MIVELLGVVALSQTGGGMFTGNDLWDSCRQAEGSADFVTCFGFVAGVADTYRAMHLINGAGDPECLPPSVTYGQLQAVATEYLRANPGNRHLPAAGLVLISLSVAFDCQITPPEVDENPFALR